MKYLSGQLKLPTKSEMLADWYDNHVTRNLTHNMGLVHREYTKELSSTAGIENIPEVIYSMINEVVKDFQEKQSEVRKFRYTIIDDNTFTKVKCEN